MIAPVKKTKEISQLPGTTVPLKSNISNSSMTTFASSPGLHRVMANVYAIYLKVHAEDDQGKKDVQQMLKKQIQEHNNSTVYYQKWNGHINALQLGLTGLAFVGLVFYDPSKVSENFGAANQVINIAGRTPEHYLTSQITRESSGANLKKSDYDHQGQKIANSSSSQQMFQQPLQGAQDALTQSARA